MCRSVEGVDGRAGKLLDWATTIAQLLIIPYFTLQGVAWWNHEQRIRANTATYLVMEGNRFTSEDGLEVWREIASIQARLDNKADIMGAAPVREDIAELKEQLQRLRDRLNMP